MSSNNTIGDKSFVLKLVLMAVPPVIVVFVGTEVLGLSRIHAVQGEPLIRVDYGKYMSGCADFVI